MTLHPGAQLGRYLITHKLGTGGMGDVYAAEDTSLRRKIAIKVLQPGSDHWDERLEREARVVASLNHPNIVTLYSIERLEGLTFLTMELVEGRSLAHMLQSGSLSLSEFFALAPALADAVAAAHGRGITHRDLKPSNIIITSDGRPKILDFGIARAADGHDAQADTTTGTGPTKIVGTVGYMSPEQAEGKSADHRSDIFSLGVVLYEMLSGRRPFSGETLATYSAALLRDKPASPSTLRAHVPIELSRIVRRCLVTNPDRRYDSARDLRNDLYEVQQILDSEALSAVPGLEGEGSAQSSVTHCLNCGQMVNGRFCKHCGQRANTRRLDFESFVAESITATTLASSRLGSTIWSMVVRPGPTVQDYLQGKRARYQSPIAYFAIGYLVFWACAHFVAEPNGLPAGTMATMSREVLFAGMIGMSLLGYVATTRPVLNFVETTVLFAFLYGTICFVAPVAIAMVIPFRSAVARLSQAQQDLVIDVPVIAFLAYMGYDACKTLGIPFWRFLVAVVGGVLYFVLFREVLGFK